MKVSFAEVKRHVIEWSKRDEELDNAIDAYNEAEREVEQQVAKLRAEFRENFDKKHNMGRLYRRCDLWSRKTRAVKKALEERYPGLTITSFGKTTDMVSLSYLGERETVPWEDVEDWMIITVLQSDHGREEA